MNIASLQHHNYALHQEGCGLNLEIEMYSRNELIKLQLLAKLTRFFVLYLERIKEFQASDPTLAA